MDRTRGGRICRAAAPGRPAAISSTPAPASQRRPPSALRATQKPQILRASAPNSSSDRVDTWRGTMAEIPQRARRRRSPGPAPARRTARFGDCAKGKLHCDRNAGVSYRPHPGCAPHGGRKPAFTASESLHLLDIPCIYRSARLPHAPGGARKTHAAASNRHNSAHLDLSFVQFAVEG